MAQGSGQVVVVTGGAGFIGSHTVEHLLSQGCRVAVLDNFRTGRRENLAAVAGHDGLKLLEANVTEGLWPALQPVEEEWGPVTAMVHLAAQTSVVYSMQNPIDDIRSNYVSTAQVLEYARTRGVKSVVFSSSSATYGEVDLPRVSEEVPTQPLSPYGIHKLSSEALLRSYTNTYGIATQPLRFFNVYGPRQDPRSPYAGVISLFVERALRNEPLTIFGDGEQTRDFVYVKEVAQALGMACFQASGRGEPVNIATGHAITVNQLAEMIRDLCGSSSDIQHLPARSGEIRHSCADVSRAKTALGFEARLSVKEGLRETVAWMKGSS